MSGLLELAARIEAAEGPSRELDAEINVATMTWRRLSEGGNPAFTASLDAAMQLVSDEHRAGVLYHAMQRIQQTGFPNTTFLQRLILEIVAAALRARAATTEGVGNG
jgi:hypothetical protein